MKLEIWDYLTGIPLLFCSLVAVCLILERLFFLIAQKNLTQKENLEISLCIQEQRLDSALLILDKPKFGFQHLIKELDNHKMSEKYVRDEAINLLLNRYSSQLRKRLSGLLTISALAPMLGLLGTIVGLMRSFQNISLIQGSIQPAMLADGIWQALITTAMGMMIAAICILFHALFKSRIRHHLNELTFLLNQLSFCIEFNKSHER